MSFFQSQNAQGHCREVWVRPVTVKNSLYRLNYFFNFLIFFENCIETYNDVKTFAEAFLEDLEGATSREGSEA